MENPKDWVDAAKSIVSQALGWGFVVFIITALLYASFEFQYIDKMAISGYVYDITKILLVMSTGLFLVGILTRVAKLSAAIIQFPITMWNTFSYRSSERTRLLENVGMLTRLDTLYLLLFMKQIKGRFISPGRIDTIDRLVSSDLISSEDENTFYSGTEGQHMRVNPLIMGNKPRKKIEKLVENNFPNVVEDLEAHQQAIDDERRRVANERRFGRI